MSDKLMMDLIARIEPQLFWLLLKIMVAGVALLLIKGILENIVAWIQFSLNKRLGIGVQVRVRGRVGKISWYNQKWIFVKTKQGEIIIPTKRWMFEAWEIINNSGAKQ